MKFIDFFPALNDKLDKYKIHFATGPANNDPLHSFFKNEFKEWQEYQTKQNFEREYIISLIYLNTNEWLFVGIYKSISSKWIGNIYEYETELVDYKSELIGRLIIRFEKNFRASYLLLENHIDNMNLSEIKRERITISSFSGYENIYLDFNYLKTIIENEEITWKTALQNVKGVYLIGDRMSGKLYVGSAYGNDAFWSRWAQYCSNGHGGNIELKRIIKERGENYAQNFYFSILEIWASTTNDNEIIVRESHWKKILMTREFGYNKN